MKSPKIVVGFLVLFGATMVFVTTKAFLRKSGNTGLDTAKIGQIRSSHIASKGRQ